MNRMVSSVSIMIVALCVIPTAAFPADTIPSHVSRDRNYSQLFMQLEHVDAIREGAKDAKSVLYVFFDPNCYYCHLTWKALQPYEAVGLQVHWVPVAYQQPTSAGRAASIMQASDRAAALRKNEIGYVPEKYNGGIQSMDKVPSTLMAQFLANTQLMQKFGAPGTPALVWKDRDGKVQFRAGLPRLSELPEITRLPLQAVEDHELEKFQ